MADDSNVTPMRLPPMGDPPENSTTTKPDNLCRKPVGYRLDLDTIADIKAMGRKLGKTDTEIITSAVRSMRDHREAYKMDTLDDPILRHYVALQWCIGVFQGMGRKDLVERLNAFFEDK
jgi:hypothetical protein